MLSYLPDNIIRHLTEQVLSPARLGRPVEFGHLVQYVIENPYLNGTIIRLDGGARLHY